MSLIIAAFFGVVLLTTSSHADMFPGLNEYHDICQELISGVDNNAIEFKHLISGVVLPKETITRSELCTRLVTRHNANAASYIGITISHATCMNALLAPQFYGPADWNLWAGRHCGKWYGLYPVASDPDNALWHPATATYDPILMETFYRQNVKFESRTCCKDGWNESGGNTYSVAWGWDPKDMTDHGGYQGSCIAYSFTASSTTSSASCLIWITGEEAFLECVATGSFGRRRTSAGFWGYGLWSLHSPSVYCLADAATPDRHILGPFQG